VVTNKSLLWLGNQNLGVAALLVHQGMDTMGAAGWVLIFLSVTYLVVAIIRSVKTRRRSVTLTETLLANVLQNLGQH
jgi:hypothetical protein